MLSVLTKRIKKGLGNLYLHGWQISGSHSAKEHTPMSGPDITLLPIHTRYPSGRAALLAWHINDGRGEFIFSVCLRAGWARENTDFRLAGFSSCSLSPRDFPGLFERTSDDWWRVREAVVGQLPANVEAERLA